MARPFQQIAMVLKYGTLHRLLDLAKLIPPKRVGSTANAIGSTLNSIIPLRRRVQSNMELALGSGKVPANAAAEYFNKYGLWAVYATQAYHRGWTESGVTEWMRFDPHSVKTLEDALAGGKGVVFAIPHLIGHEVTAGIMARNYPTVGLVRESKYAPHMRVKEHFYNTTGKCNVIFRPRRGSVAADMRVCTRSLKEGNILVVTPDLLVKPGDGVAIQLLGRTLSLRPGIISLAMVTGAPIVNAFLIWEQDHVVIHCQEPKEYFRTGNREQTMVNGMQSWCDTFSGYLQQYPSSWQFWMDRHWSEIWQQSLADRSE